MAEAVTPAAGGDDGAARAGDARPVRSAARGGDGAARPGDPRRPVRSAHAPKFALLTGALIGIAIGAVALAVVLIAGGRGTDSPGWSFWHPSMRGIDAAQEIANYVGPQYRLPNGKQLVTVKGGPLRIASLPAHVAKREANGATSILEGDAALFTLCGDGTRCTIPGKPSEARAILLDREGLELALYAFRYAGVDMVVELLPPSYSLPHRRPGQKAPTVRVKPRSTAMLFRRDEYADVIDEPLEETLPPPTPTVKTIARAPEVPLIGSVARNAVFGVSFVQAQDASAVVLLEPLK